MRANAASLNTLPVVFAPVVAANLPAECTPGSTAGERSAAPSDRFAAANAAPSRPPPSTARAARTRRGGSGAPRRSRRRRGTPSRRARCPPRPRLPRGPRTQERRHRDRGGRAGRPRATAASTTRPRTSSWSGLRGTNPDGPPIVASLGVSSGRYASPDATRRETRGRRRRTRSRPSAVALARPRLTSPRKTRSGTPHRASHRQRRCRPRNASRATFGGISNVRKRSGFLGTSSFRVDARVTTKKK